MSRHAAFTALAFALALHGTSQASADDSRATYTRAVVAVTELVFGASVDRFLPGGGVAFVTGGDRSVTRTLTEVEGTDCAFTYREGGIDTLRLDFSGLSPVTSRLHTGGQDVLRLSGPRIRCRVRDGEPVDCQDNLNLRDASASRSADWRSRQALDFLLARCSQAAHGSPSSR